jgi:hypothetical protein
MTQLHGIIADLHVSVPEVQFPVAQSASGDPEQHLSCANVLKTNASFVPLQSPYDIAVGVNGCLYAQNRLQKGRYYGWIMGDFMTEEACRAIWQTNYFVFD